MVTILVVDDEPLIRWALRETLEAAGYCVLEAGSAREAISRISHLDGHSLKVALLDLRLPDSDDLSLLHRVRTDVPNCQVIVMTAHGTPDILRDALDQGAFDTLSKPFDLSRILGLVQAAATVA
jgi:DNA-binding NtrC family response regulator